MMKKSKTRLFVDKKISQNLIVYIKNKQHHFLKNVLRVKINDQINIFDGYFRIVKNDFISIREEPKDPRAVSLRSQLDDLILKINNKPNRLATIDEAFRVQKLVEEILSKT